MHGQKNIKSSCSNFEDLTRKTHCYLRSVQAVVTVRTASLASGAFAANVFSSQYVQDIFAFQNFVLSSKFNCLFRYPSLLHSPSSQFFICFFLSAFLRFVFLTYFYHFFIFSFVLIFFNVHFLYFFSWSYEWCRKAKNHWGSMQNYLRTIQDSNKIPSSASRTPEKDS